ncbi:MAG: hypothetical protein JNL98_03465 [Bryobacterales bacterium]|nr:hypothetical protein [Bryobacterales bacterium]
MPLFVMLGFVFVVANSPNRFLYDEPYFVNYVPLLHEHGFTPNFLNSLTGAAGPLYAVIHRICEPFTHLQPPRMRLVNVLLLCVLTGVLASAVKRYLPSRRWFVIGGVLVVPMTWVTAGMALSEMPAMLFVALSLYCQLKGLAAFEAHRQFTIWFLLSGACLGVAVWGRQPYLLLLSIPIVLAIVERRLRVAAVLFVSVVAVCTIPLFVIWQGLTPPSHHSLQQGIAVSHGVLSLGYVAICSMLLAPRRPSLSAMQTLVVMTSILALNAAFEVLQLYPVRSAAQRYLSPPMLHAYGIACGSLFASVGVVFFMSQLQTIWSNRDKLQTLAVNAGLLCIALSPLFVAHQYSSRYTAMSLPYLIMASAPLYRENMKSFGSHALGYILGAMSLYGYYSY